MEQTKPEKSASQAIAEIRRNLSEKCEVDHKLNQRVKYAEYLKNSKIRKNCILYEEKEEVENVPRKIFLYLFNNAGKKYTHIWSVNDEEQLAALQKKYAGCGNVFCVKRDSDEYLQYLASAQYLVNNDVFPEYFTKNKGQVYFNTWIAGSDKSVGYQAKNGKIRSASYIRNFLSADYLFSHNAEMTADLKEAFKLDGIYEGRILQLDGQLDDDTVCQQIEKAVFRKNFTRQGICCNETKKIKVLFYGGTMAVNGITHSFLALLKAIDYNKFDVSVVARGASDKNVAAMIEEIPQQVRVLYRNATFNATIEEHASHMYIMEHGIQGKASVPEAMYRREIRHSLGDAVFDYAIEFSGFSRMFALMFAYMKNTKKIIWQHNDLKKECTRIQHGGNDMSVFVNTCASAYPVFDKIVSCSDSTMIVNRKNFETLKTRGRFTYARNLIHLERITSETAENTILTENDKEYYISNMDRQDENSVVIETIPVPDKDAINFVSMGRLSPEKNQENLILAVAKLYQENPDVRLYILGEGPLRKQFEKIIKENGLEKIVHLVGNLTKPFHFMGRCQCFVLPSHYEGMPLVVQEARVVGLPVILGDFESASEVQVENGQLLVGQDMDAIYNGLKSYVNGEVPRYQFDAECFNKEVYQDFEKLFDK